MKKIINFFLLTIMVFTLSCQKQETVAYYTGGTAPVLTGVSNSGGTVLNLRAPDSATVALTLNWTNPNYMFNYGVSSLDVSYLVEIDTLGSNFTNPSRLQLSVSKDLSLAFTESYLSGKLTSGLGLDTAHAHNLQMRVTATAKTTGANTIPIVSNVVNFSAKPYFPPPAVNPPTTGNLYIVGSATAGAWNNPVPLPSQQFTKVSATLFTITIPLTGGQEFLFLPLNGDWGHKFACNKTASPPSGDAGGVFGYDWSDNFPGPTATGTYKITVNFQAGTYTVVKQ